MRLKTKAQVLSLAGLAGGFIQLQIWAHPRPPADAMMPAPAATAAFAGFPLGKATRVELNGDSGSLLRLSALEQREQLRDWLMLAVLSDASLQPGALQEAVFDLQPLRRGYLAPAAAFQFGATRSRALDDGNVVALVPKGPAQEQAANLAHVADEQRKNLGGVPNSLLVFEYELDQPERVAWVTRRPSLPGSELFTAAYGYRRQAVTSLAELAAFLSAVDDLTDVSRGQGMVVGGRVRSGPMPRHLSIEEVAALYQSETKIQEAEKERQTLEARWSHVPYNTEAEKVLLESQMRREVEELDERLGGSRAQGSGFSLDPAYDYDRLAEFLHKFEQPLAEAAGKDRTAAVIAAVEEHNELPMLELFDELAHSDDAGALFLSELLSTLQRDCRFQAARYDGSLQGTEVGMVLFYTDLLAKLWALDYLSSAPTAAEVEDFVPLLKVPVSPIYLRELQQLPGTRVWFGVRDSALQPADSDNTLLFAPNVTRIYAASSNLLKPGEEAEPNAPSAAFLGWWDSHYEQVARFEPQYQRLNEIVKWSSVLGWLARGGRLDDLAYLGQQEVDHQHWFPLWARQQPDLRFRHWDGVEFLNPRPGSTFKGVTTEAMPLLTSQFFAQPDGRRALSGGVSLGSRATFEARSSIPAELKLALRRGGLDYRVLSSLDEGVKTLRTLDEVSYDLGKPGVGAFSVTAKPRAAAKLRDVDLELPNGTIQLDVRVRPDSLRLETATGTNPVGVLDVARDKSGFAAAFRSLDVERAGDLTRRAADAAVQGIDPKTALAGSDGVSTVLRLEGEDGWLVQLEGSRRWLRITPEGEPSAEIGKGLTLRAGGWRPGAPEAPRFVADWVESPPPMPTSKGTQLVVTSPRAPGAGIELEVANRGPPEGATRVELSLAGEKVSAARDSTGRYFLGSASLPDAIRSDPSRLRELFAAGGARDEAGWLSRLRDGDYAGLGRELSRDPQLAKQELERLRLDRLRESDELTAAGRPREALRLLDMLVATFGPRPEFGIRQAIARIEAGDVTRAAHSIGRSLESLGDGSRILGAIERRLAQGVEASEATGLGRLRRAVELHGLGEKGLEVAIADGPRAEVAFRVRLLDAISTRHATPAAIQPRSIYVDADVPTLASVDWSPATLRQPPSAISQAIQISELHSWEVARSEPTLIEVAKTGQRYRLASSSLGLEQLTHQSLRSDPCSDADQRNRLPACDQLVYLVTAAPLSAPAPAGSR